MTKPVYFNICGCGVALRRKVGTRLVTTGVQSCVVLLVLSRHYFFAIHLYKELTRDINNFRFFCTELKEEFERHHSDINECFVCYSNNPNSFPHALSIVDTITEVLVAPTLHQLQGAQGADVEFKAIPWKVDILPYNDQGGEIYLVLGDLYIDEIRTVREKVVCEGLVRHGFDDGFAVGIDEIMEDEFSDFNGVEEEEEGEEDYNDFYDHSYASEDELMNQYKVKKSKVKKNQW